MISQVAEDKAKVYRVRGLPAYLDRLATVNLLVQSLGDIVSDDIQLGSLALTIDPWSPAPTKTATLVFNTPPSLVQSERSATEWRLLVPGLEEPLLIDTHFCGLTALNDIPSGEHQNDCVIISGLASHPMGSWQPRKGDKSFMWIRDALPQRLSGVRFILYGYDTALTGSKSFQSTADLAVTLISALKAGGWMLMDSRPLLFLAHSLGGVILKQALMMLAGCGEAETRILRIVKGTVFFGVPSLGMKVEDIEEMVEGQPNKSLVRELSDKSDYLPSLETQFMGISYIRHMRFFWAYETSETSSLAQSEGRWQRSGPDRIMVSKESATGGRHQSAPSFVIHIDENHSNMVKFKEGDILIPILADKIREISQFKGPGLSDTASPGQALHQTDDDGVNASFQTLDMRAGSAQDLSDKYKRMNEAVLQSVRPPERDNRLEQIDENLEFTFDWVFNDSSIGLTDWLLGGQGIFWVSGKPGSGKSTMMKYIWTHPKIKELLHRWGSNSQQILTGFFFHHRGVYLQKSFEGLLRSVLTQILEANPELCVLLEDILETRFPAYTLIWKRSKGLESVNLEIPSHLWTKTLLEECLVTILRQEIMKLDLLFLFDALDEYDGTPEFIADFLKQLSLNSSSHTKIRVLFSSRPWKVFLDEFEACPGFKIHEHTQDDIHHYCAASIPENKSHSDTILNMTGEISQRAEGVFLWVKLVIRELFFVSESLDTSQDERAATTKLRQTLDALPDQLEDFYETIIYRIPPSFRRQTYILLETLSRARNRIYCEDVLDLMKLSNAKSFQDARQGQISQSFDSSNGFAKHVGDQVRTVSGGLVELVRGEYGTWFHLQFMHQTVQDFVRQPLFKHIVLGARGRATPENGHSFLAKWLLLNRMASNRLTGSDYRREHFKSIIFHLKQSEETTGLSQHQLMASIPQGIGPGNWSPLMLAVSIGLHLYLKDTLIKDRDVIAKARDNLVSGIVQSIDEGWRNITEATEMIKFLTTNGFRVEMDFNGLEKIMMRMWEERNRFRSLDWATPTAVSGKGLTTHAWEDYFHLICAAFQGCRDLAQDARRELSQAEETANAPGTSGLLHISPPGVTEQLLALGADPNLLTWGETALDAFVCLEPAVWKLEAFYPLERKDGVFRSIYDIYKVCRALAASGAMLQKATFEEWEGLMADFQRIGLDTGFFELQGCPQWLSGERIAGSRTADSIDYNNCETRPPTGSKSRRRQIAKVFNSVFTRRDR